MSFEAWIPLCVVKASPCWIGFNESLARHPLRECSEVYPGHNLIYPNKYKMFCNDTGERDQMSVSLTLAGNFISWYTVRLISSNWYPQYQVPWPIFYKNMGLLWKIMAYDIHKF